MTPLNFKHLITIENTDLHVLELILDTAKRYVKNAYHKTHQLNHLKKITVVTAFFEPSTRTRVSFELAATRLGARVIHLPIEHSAMQKGENIDDTIETLIAMNCHGFVIRHPDDHLLERLCHDLSSPCCIINAGTGSYAHPTQALLDCLTIQQHKKNFHDLSIAIIGDIKHSRVVRSQLALYKKMGVKDIRLIAPNAWLPEKLDDHYSVTESLSKGLEGCDVINTLRIQKERILESHAMDLAWYRQHYQLNEQQLSLAKPDAIVLHPGPMNRDIEISSRVADGPQSLIKSQVSNGIAIRMAVLSLLFENNLL